MTLPEMGDRIKILTGNGVLVGGNDCVGITATDVPPAMLDVGIGSCVTAWLVGTLLVDAGVRVGLATFVGTSVISMSSSGVPPKLQEDNISAIKSNKITRCGVMCLVGVFISAPFSGIRI